jgi:hypothetical protein
MGTDNRNSEFSNVLDNYLCIFPLSDFNPCILAVLNCSYSISDFMSSVSSSGKLFKISVVLYTREHSIGVRSEGGLLHEPFLLISQLAKLAHVYGYMYIYMSCKNLYELSFNA